MHEPTSILDIQRDLEQVRKHVSRDRWIAIGILLILAIITLWAVFRKSYTTVYDQQIRALQDTITAHDSRLAHEMGIFQAQRTSDSMRTGTIHNDLLRTNTVLATITKKHDKDRTIIANSSDDEQLSILADWLNQTDSI